MSKHFTRRFYAKQEAKQGMCHHEVAKFLGMTTREFADLRNAKKAPDPDILIPGDVPRWKHGTIAGFKNELERKRRAESRPLIPATA